MSPDVASVRDDFPVLDQQVDGRPLTYLDNAATPQTPRQVYETFEEYYAGYNVHRGIHALSHRASVAYATAHDRLAGVRRPTRLSVSVGSLDVRSSS